MMDCTFVFVADIVVGLGARLKKRRMMEEMVAVAEAGLFVRMCVVVVNADVSTCQ